MFNPDFIKLVEDGGIRMNWQTPFTVDDRLVALYERFGVDNVLLNGKSIKIHEADPDMLYEVEQYVYYYISKRVNGDKIVDDLRSRIQDPTYSFKSRFTQRFLESSACFTDFCQDTE